MIESVTIPDVEVMSCAFIVELVVANTNRMSNVIYRIVFTMYLFVIPSRINRKPQRYAFLHGDTVETY